MKRTKVFKVTIAITCVAAGSKFFRIQSVRVQSFDFVSLYTVELCGSSLYERPT